MAAGDVIGTRSCSCGGMTTFKESKSGAASGRCDTCGEQIFKKSPLAVNTLRDELARAGAAAPGKAPARDDDNWLKKL